MCYTYPEASGYVITEGDEIGILKLTDKWLVPGHVSSYS